ncbi:MAG: pseudouridine synthase [Pseudomonadota bacterium]|nr:pseudouridine synthase [Pseudomonadota bacterium]
MTERIQKVLARVGLGSRREVERWIREGRVTVDGRLAELGRQIENSSRVEVDGRPIPLGARASAPAKLLLYHKPVGQICSRDDPQGRATVFEALPRLRGRRWVSVGRLDINTSGLLLFTTDGELAHRLMHPSSGIEREYRCRVRGDPGEREFKRLLAGVRLSGQVCRFESIESGRGSGANRWFQVVLKEGRNREVRRMWQSVGCTVSRLIRVRYGPFRLDRQHSAGTCLELKAPDWDRLLQQKGQSQRGVRGRKAGRRRARSG